MRGKIRNPKSEIRNKSKIQMTKTPHSGFWSFEFSDLDLFRISDFGFRILLRHRIVVVESRRFLAEHRFAQAVGPDADAEAHVAGRLAAYLDAVDHVGPRRELRQRLENHLAALDAETVVAAPLGRTEFHLLGQRT